MKTQLTRSIESTIITAVCLMVHLSFMFAVTSVQAQSDAFCEERLAAAEENYYTGYFETAIDLIKDCLKHGDLSNDTKIRACKLLSLSYLANENPGEARVCVEKLLEMVPDYSPNIETEPRQFVELVLTVKSEMYESANAENPEAQQVQTQSIHKEQEPSSGASKWILIGAATGGVVAAIVTLAMRGAPDDPNGDGNGNRNGGPPR